eukprot:TRINITY_DN2017_c0_g1_i2.p1 TRINITY_DN2017_c0_g1~~TRINITY_DN2017_c0_g1_i2.p1  ORF type:complete len:1311 (-),score=340.04 TRINITY_DN2017_c0_g1_i2:45-3977(-)
MERELVWAPSPTLGWALGTVTAVNGDNVVVQTQEGEALKASKKDILLYQDSHKADVTDMITLPEAHEARILFNLQQRFKSDQIYTYIGPVIISINPFKDAKIYSDRIIQEYLQSSEPRTELPPHLYTIAHSAYNSLVLRGESQSVVISGESGAGKTEATKVILKYLTVACGGTTTGKELSQKIMATNPLLEAFGNAKTVRNNNSSRFGKFISIVFDPDGSLNSASINNYLLETVRVVTQAPNERNYHVFYQLVTGTSAQERSAYKLKSDPSQYHYLKNGNMIVDGIDDKDWFIKLKESMGTLGIKEDEQYEIFSLLSGILHLGNVDFDGQDEVKIKNTGQLSVVASLFKVQESLLTTALTLRIVSGGNRQTTYNVPLSYPQAIENRDALAKSLYSHLFDYLVERINQPLLGNNPPLENLDKDPRKFIGVLDIYGFEVFQQNSMEQFCINYANEKLHSQFNQHMFKAEQALYSKEGIPWENIKFVDNQDCIDLIEGFGGILSMLDEEGKIPRGSDKSLIEKLFRKHGRHPRFRYNQRNPILFGLDHYAGVVDYDITGFIQKNKDTLLKDLVSVMWSSDSQFIQKLFVNECQDLTGVTDRFKANTIKNNKPQAAKATVCSSFNKSLSSLVTILASSMRHYVRCIKPNDKAQAGLFLSNKVLQQLKSNGIFETIRMRKAGYASHIPFEVFFNRFSFLGMKKDTKEQISMFLQSSFPDTSQWIVGTTKVFLREKVSDSLENLRRDIYIKSIITIQARIRTFYQSRKLEIDKARKFKAALVLQNHIRRYYAIQKARMLYELIRRMKAAITIQKIFRRQQARGQLIEFIIAKRQRIERERLEKERIEKERQERLEKERIERERQERLEKERIEKERKEKERLENEKIAKEKDKQEKERMERERAEREKERLEKEKKDKLEKELIEKEREKERLEKEKKEKERIDKERELREKERETEKSPGKKEIDTKPYLETTEVDKTKSLKAEHIITIQRHIRAFASKRLAIGLALLKYDELKESLLQLEKERNEWRQRMQKVKENAGDSKKYPDKIEKRRSTTDPYLKNAESKSVRTFWKPNAKPPSNNIYLTVKSHNSLDKGRTNIIRAAKKQQRKASINIFLENHSTDTYSVTYSHEPFILPPEAVIPSKKQASPRDSPPSPGGDKGIMSPRSVLSPRDKPRRPDIDLDIGMNRRRNNATSKPPPPLATDRGASKMNTNPVGTVKLSFLPFRQVSRLWGSQKYKTGAKDTKKAYPRLRNVFGEEEPSPENTDKTQRRMKGRSRSVPNLEALMSGNPEDASLERAVGRGINPFSTYKHDPLL